MVIAGPLVTLPPPPTVQINPVEYEVRLPETKLILGSDASSPDLAYLWTLPNGSVNNLKIFNKVVRDKDVIEIDLAPEPDVLDFVLTVTDSFNRTATSTSKVTVKQARSAQVLRFFDEKGPQMRPSIAVPRENLLPQLSTHK